MASPLQTSNITHGNPLGTPQGAAGDPSGSPSVAPNVASARSAHGRENANTSLGTFQVCAFQLPPVIQLPYHSSSPLGINAHQMYYRSNPGLPKCLR
jgi:hypothetical protein